MKNDHRYAFESFDSFPTRQKKIWYEFRFGVRSYGWWFCDFDRVLQAALWVTMRKYNISANLVRTIEQLYDKATSAVQMNGSIGEWFRTTVGVRQECLLTPTLFNIFLERIKSDALEEHDGKIRRQKYYQSVVCR